MNINRYLGIPLLILTLAFASCSSSVKYEQTQTITFPSKDGLEVTADIYLTGDLADPIILMFHQSASSRGEYAAIAPRLQALGYNCLAVDLRWGKRDFVNGVDNETARIYGSHEIVDAYEDTEEFVYGEVWPRMFDSYQDMEAAVDWARSQGFVGDLIVWGSSFSAMLQFKLARLYKQEVTALVSYSPGEYYGRDTTMLNSWASVIDQPVYLAAGQDSAEFLMTRPIFESLKNSQSSYHHASKGQHGSSMLGEEENWESLLKFLGRFKNYEAEDYLTFAKQAGAWLINQYDTDSLQWPDAIDEPENTTLSFSGGLAGKVTHLLELHKATKQQRYLDVARLAADQLLNQLPSKSDSLRGVFWAFSAYGNVCGSGFALIEMFKETGDQRYRDGAAQMVDLLDHFAVNKVDTLSWDLGNDVLGGLAGTGLFLLDAAKELDSQRAMEMASAAGHTLMNRAIREGGGYNWKRGQNGRFVLPNFSHGPAGIGYFLARLYEETEDEAFLTGAEKAITYLDSVAYTESDTYLIPYGFPDPGWRRAFDIGWAHGPAGVARLFYQMYKLDKDEKWLEKMEACFRGILLSDAIGDIDPMFGSQPFSIDQRFGLASVASFALDAYNATGKSEYKDYGLALLDHIIRKAQFDQGMHWPIPRFGFMANAGQLTSFTGYFYGNAGFGSLLLKGYGSLSGQSATIRFVDDPFK